MNSYYYKTLKILVQTTSAVSEESSQLIVYISEMVLFVCIHADIIKRLYTEKTWFTSRKSSTTTTGKLPTNIL